MNIAATLNHCRPEAIWSLTGNTYSGLEWLDATQSKPTVAELEAAWVQLSSQPTPTERRASMAAAFDALPLTVQASFYTARMTAEAAMDRGRFDIARAIIEAVDVPADLEATKEAILSHFP
jgi:hypothetical protein